MASFVTVIVLTVLIDVLVAGFSRRCLTAILGSVAGTVVTCLSAWGLTILLKLDGGDLPYVVPLLSQSAMQVDTRSLYIGMMLLANSGALMDLSMEEVHRHKPDISRRALMKSGTVGRAKRVRHNDDDIDAGIFRQLSVDADVLRRAGNAADGHHQPEICRFAAAQHACRVVRLGSGGTADGADCHGHVSAKAETG